MGKIWGTTKPLLVTPLIEVHEIEVKPNSYCSIHKHNFKFNAFYVLKGCIEIVIEKTRYDLTDVTSLKKGQFTTVEPGEYHYFRTGDESAKLLEIYYPSMLSDDIIRKTVGGCKDE